MVVPAYMRCATCIFFSPNLRNDGRTGQCRRRAPYLEQFEDDRAPRTIWPLVGHDAFCGDHSTLEEETSG